ncbi:MAG: polysaccharide pyruvyl transferase family protein [Pseudomonadota bacterium]
MAPPVVLFGAFDRHNFGDLLFPHIAAALLPGRELRVAGLAERDLRPFGGHAVQALHRLAQQGQLAGAQLLHAGGEILGCTARQAAVMLLQPEEVDATLSYIEQHPEDEARWQRAVTGTGATMPYVASRREWPMLVRVVFAASGGTQLAALPPAWRDEVLQRLAAADAVSVRDAVTQATLQAAGVNAALLPDPAVMTRDLFGPRIQACGAQGPVAALRAAWPGGYLAAQFSAEFGDDRALDALARELEAAVAATGLGLVLFRAGAAPWHDDAGMLVRLAQRLARPPHLFESLDLWHLCALLAHARAYAGSSLHGRIVAAAFGVPVVGLLKPGETQDTGKVAAYARTWETPLQPLLASPDGLAAALQRSLAGGVTPRQAQAARWVSAYRAGFAALMP